jgi:hypothetical protein
VTTPVRRAAAALLCGLLAVTAGACTSDENASPRPEPSVSPSPSEGSDVTLDAKPAPFKVRVTRVAGRMKPQDRDVLADNVGKVVSAYFDDAFLDGDYPRDDFHDAFTTFSAEAAKQAWHDRDLLSNSDLGPSTESVLARRRTAYLSVLAPHKVAAGVTARVDLRFLADRGDAPDKEVTVKGRLMLTRKQDGGWKIFGYDLSQSATTVGEGS